MEKTLESSASGSLFFQGCNASEIWLPTINELSISRPPAGIPGSKADWVHLPLKEVRWLKKLQAVWDSLLSANKSHFQDLTSTVSLRSGELLSENWNSQHCHCCQLHDQRICQLHPHRNSSVPSCVTLFRNIYQKQFWNLKKWMVKTKFWFISFWGLLFSSASRFIKKLEIDKKVVSSCPTLWFSCFQTLANKIDRSCIFRIPEIWQSKDTPKINNPFIFFRTKNYDSRIHFPPVCRSLRLTLGSPDPWPFSKTCQAKPLELLALKDG